jgi:hypothetical protein
MLNTTTAVEILKGLRPHSVVSLPDGSRALVMCQTREQVVVLVGREVRTVERWLCEEVSK